MVIAIKNSIEEIMENTLLKKLNDESIKIIDSITKNEIFCQDLPIESYLETTLPIFFGGELAGKTSDEILKMQTQLFKA